MKKTIPLLIAVLLCQGCKESKYENEDVNTKRAVRVDFNDADWLSAVKSARESFPIFLEKVSKDSDGRPSSPSKAVLKAYFSDISAPKDGEHLWIAYVDYDGENIYGVVESNPLNLDTPKLGDEVRFTLDQLTDWLVVREGKASGAYTINLLRSRMTQSELKAYDSHYQFKFAEIKPAQQSRGW